MRTIKRLKTLVLLVGTLGAFLGLGSCPQVEQPAPAAPPTSPAEIPGPMALRFPSAVTINVEVTTAASGEFSDEIKLGSGLLTFIQKVVDRVVSSDGILGGVVVAIDPSITHFTTTVPADSEIFAGEELKIDFSKYESIKPETNDCSGSTAGDLVCYRIWISGKPFLAGFFTAIPTDFHDGAGHLWFRPVRGLFAGAGKTSPDQLVHMGLTWDHQISSDMTTEMFFSGASGGMKIEAPRMNAHGFIRQQGAEEATAIKTAKTRASFASPKGVPTGEMKTVGRWKEDEDFWSGKIDLNFWMTSIENPDICARLSTGDGVDDSYCAAIETEDEEFLDPAETEDFTLPNDFPPSPTF